MSSDDEDYSAVDPRAHKKLLSEINEIVKIQHIKKPVRTEPALKNSEFHLVKSKVSYDSDDDLSQAKKKVSIANVVDVLRKNTKQKKVGKQLKDVFKNDNVLVKPMEKIHAEKLQRTIAYDNTKVKLGRWDAIVTKNRAAEQLTFPLDQSRANYNEKKNAQQFRYKTKMMQEMEDLRNEYYPKSTEPDEPETPIELLTLKELKERRKELARLKMRESNQMIKKRMQGKIKSKKYHKLKKRDEMKRKMKEFEEMKATNPELALKELEKIEKQRVKERTTLRHKNTGTWAKNQMIRAKYDENVKKDLEEQLTIGRELTQKQNQSESSESEDDDTVLVKTMEDNPWIKEKNTDEAFSGYKKFWEEHNKKSVPNKVEENDEESSSESSVDKEEQENSADEKHSESQSDDENSLDDLDDLFDEAIDDLTEKVDSKMSKIKPKLLEEMNEDDKKMKMKKRKTNPKDADYLGFQKKARLADVDVGLNEDEEDDREMENGSRNRSKKLLEEAHKLKKEKESFLQGEINPENFLNVKSKHLITAIPKNQNFDEIDDEDEVEKISKANKMSLAEAFENDDIVNDFENELEENETSKTAVSSKLPGWGSWSGYGVKEKEQKPKKEKTIKNRKSRVIVSKVVNEKLQKHLISQVPFPFKSIQDFEASMRMPIGRDFIPASAYEKLTIPKIVTKSGKVIEPMSEESLVQGAEGGNLKKFAKKNGKFSKTIKK